jgi:MoxR-like ATPase
MLVRQSTSLSLGRIYPVLMRRGNEIDLRKLEDRLDDDDWAVRQAAAQALGRIWYHSYHQGKITLKEIEEKLEDLNWSVRQAAAQTLGQIYPLLIKHGSAVRLKKLEERLWDADVDRSVCRAAAIALGRIWPYSYHKKKITLKALEEKLKDENWFVHQAAALAMINIYPSLIKEESDAELNKLERRLKDKDWTIRQAAARACIKILSSFIFNRQDALNNVLASFNKLLGEPMQGTISGTHSRQIEIGEKTLTVGDLVLERESPNEDIPACVMTSTGYHILETLGFGYLLKHSVLLLGPTSTGKSFLIKWLSQVLGFRHLAYAINPFTSKFEIIGGIKPDSRGRFLWQEGILLKAAREGLWLVLEEINLASSEVVEILNDFLITGKMSYSENGEQRELYPHPDFRLFATGNPESYSQRQKLSEIFLSRFKIFYQKELSEEELSQVLSSLFRMSASLALLIARFHITLQNQADSRIIGMGEKDPYAFTLRDIIRLGKRLEPFLKQESEDVEFLRKLYLEFFCVYIGRIRNEAERDAMVSLLDTYFGFRAKGLDLDAVRSARSVDLMPLMKSLTTSKGSDFVPQQEAEISPTPTQKMNLYLILKALINHEPVLLVGNPASGKTTLVRYLAREKQTNLFFVNLSSDTGIEELLGGYIQDGHGNWHYRRGLLFTAIEQGSWLLIDEANLSPLSEYLNTLLDFGYVVDEKENVCHAHPNFRLFLAINPPSVHQSRNLLSPALKSRFAEIWVDELTNADELASLIDTWSHAQSTALGFQEKKMDKRRILDKKAATDKNAEKKAPKKEEATAYKRYTHFTT